MTEPNNPLFEDEKEFLERKKLEYERALRGDVEEIKVQTIHAGKVALIGASVVGSIWLLVKAFSGGKPKKKHKKGKHKHAATFEDYAGFDGYDDGNDQAFQDLDSPYYSPEYAYDNADRLVGDDGFYQAGEDEGLLYQQAGEPGDYAYAPTDTDADDNGLSDYPDFPAHSSSQHGASAEVDTTYGSHTDEDHGYDVTPASSFASTTSYEARPYDDSRRLPDSNSFADDEDDEPIKPAATAKPASKKKAVVPAIVAFAQSETGKVIVAQAAAIAMAFVTKKVKDILPSDADKIGKNADLAASSAPVGVPPATWPATTAAQDVSAAAHHDDKTPPREPLA